MSPVFVLRGNLAAEVSEVPELLRKRPALRSEGGAADGSCALTAGPHGAGTYRAAPSQVSQTSAGTTHAAPAR